MDAIAAFAEHVTRTRYDDLPAAALDAAKVLILDSLGVGVVGSAGPFVPELRHAAGGWGSGAEARVWVSGARLPAPAAALCNAYQLHNSEFDCIHERAVVHPMAVLLPAAMAHAERAGGVSGRDLLTAIVLGVDVGASLGIASKSGLRFFRPATAGGFAASAAVGRLMGFDAARLVNAFGALLGQTCGTMQAHAEGSPLLALQVGFNARNALVACDLAAQGVAGPQEVLEGPFGYFALFEGAHDLAPVVAAPRRALAGRRGGAQALPDRARDPWRARRRARAAAGAWLRRGRRAERRLHRAAVDGASGRAAGAARDERQPGPPVRGLRAGLRAAGRRGRRRRLCRSGARRSRAPGARGADRGAGGRQSRCQRADPGGGRHRAHRRPPRTRPGSRRSMAARRGRWAPRRG